MGLDMYLKVRKSEYTSEFRGNMEKYPDEIEQVALTKNTLGKSICVERDYLVGYWRKANAIHQWIVDNCAEGVDDCKPVYMEEEKLSTLRTLCLQVLVDPSQGEKLLPTSDGFFFGSVEYDNWYMEDIKYTAELLQGVLKLLKEHPGEYDIIYEASW